MEYKIRASQTHIINDCLRRYYYLQNKDRVKAEHPDIKEGYLNTATVFGTLLHKTLESMLDKEEIVQESYKLCKGIPNKMFGKLYENPRGLGEQVYYTAVKLLTYVQGKPYKDRFRELSKFETSLETEIDGIKVTGSIDLIDHEGTITDLKTIGEGVNKNYISQLYTYYVLAKKNDIDVRDNAKIIKVTRPVEKNQSRIYVSEDKYDMSGCKTYIRQTINKVVWLKEQNPKSVLDVSNNPSSNECKFCPLYKTSACLETNKISNR